MPFSPLSARTAAAPVRAVLAAAALIAVVCSLVLVRPLPASAAPLRLHHQGAVLHLRGSALRLRQSAAMLTASTSTSTSTASAAPWWGVTTAGLPTDTSEETTLASEVGSSPHVAMWYAQWATASDFPASEATSMASGGAVPEITWEPWDPSAGVNQPSYSLAAIANGSWDRYIKRWASEITSWGQPLRLRFAQEMNGNWYPWDEGVNGNAPGSFVKAWRHVHGIFAKAGATNVTWIWSPNVPFSGSTSLSELWPGASEVGEMALDGYNWGTTQSWSSWQSFSDVFGAGVSQLQALSTTLPISLGEVASTEVGGDKAAWITGMFTQLQAWPQVHGFVWFDINKETDWRIDSSSTSLASFTAGLGCYLAGMPMSTASCSAG